MASYERIENVIKEKYGNVKNYKIEEIATILNITAIQLNNFLLEKQIITKEKNKYGQNIYNLTPAYLNLGLVFTDSKEHNISVRLIYTEKGKDFIREIYIKFIFKKALINIWKEKAISNLEKGYFYREDTMKCKLYYDIMMELNIDFFEKNNIRLYSEYHIEKTDQKADMALIDISDEDNLNILSIIELKNKKLNSTTNDKISKDFDKISNYLKEIPNIDTFMITIAYDVESNYLGKSWVEALELKKEFENKKFVELTLDFSESEGKMKTCVKDFSKF